MYWPDYNPRKRPRGSSLAPAIFLGLVLGLLFGLLIVGPLNGWRQRPTAPPDAPGEASANPQGRAAAVEEPVVIASPTAAPPSRSAPLAPEFALPDLFDESLNRSLDDYSGRPVILNFWASWCVPCKVEMPALQRAYDKYRSAGLAVLGVNQSFVDDLDAARAFVDDLALTFPNVRDDTGKTSEGLYQVMGLPTSVFIAPNGEIAHKQVGQMTDEQIELLSQQLIVGDRIAPSG